MEQIRIKPVPIIGVLSATDVGRLNQQELMVCQKTWSAAFHVEQYLRTSSFQLTAYQGVINGGVIFIYLRARR